MQRTTRISGSKRLGPDGRPAALPRRRNPPWRNLVRLLWDGALWSAIAGADPTKGVTISAATPAEALRRMADEFERGTVRPDPRLRPCDLGFTTEAVT